MNSDSADSTHPASTDPKLPRTARGRETRRKLLDAAAGEFGEKGFHEASVSSITRRAGVALGSFYTYFDSKEALFQALVRDLSERVKVGAVEAVSAVQQEAEEANEPVSAIAIERTILGKFLDFAHDNKEIYRIIDESEFVDPENYRRHYQSAAQRIYERLKAGAASGELRPDIDEAHGWALMGMNVFLGLRYAVWDSERSTEDIAAIASSMIADGLKRRSEDESRA